jgi:hypothetical protein
MLAHLPSDIIVTLTGKVPVHNPEGMNDSGNPQAKGEENVDRSLSSSTAKKDCRRRENNGEQVIKHPL